MYHSLSTRHTCHDHCPYSKSEVYTASPVREKERGSNIKKIKMPVLDSEFKRLWCDCHPSAFHVRCAEKWLNKIIIWCCLWCLLPENDEFLRCVYTANRKFRFYCASEIQKLSEQYNNCLGSHTCKEYNLSTHNCEPYENGWTDRNSVCSMDSVGPSWNLVLIEARIPMRRDTLGNIQGAAKSISFKFSGNISPTTKNF